MNLIKQPNSWSCGIASLAMLLESDINSLIKDLGHDGSQIIFPKAKEPLSRRSFVLDELQSLCFMRGKVLAPFEGFPALEHETDTFQLYTVDFAWSRLEKIMLGRFGLIEGFYSLDRPHACAWDGKNVYDPHDPKIYSLDDPAAIRISCFWMLK